jgi:hypothetical protein
MLFRCLATSTFVARSSFVGFHTWCVSMRVAFLMGGEHAFRR